MATALYVTYVNPKLRQTLTVHPKLRQTLTIHIKVMLGLALTPSRYAYGPAQQGSAGRNALIVWEEMYSSLVCIDYDDCRRKSCVGHGMCMGHDPNATICGMGHDPNGKLQYVRALRIKLAAYKYSELRCV